MKFPKRPNLAPPYPGPIGIPFAHPSAAFPHKCLELNGSGWASHADDPALNMGVGDFMGGCWLKWDGTIAGSGNIDGITGKGIGTDRYYLRIESSNGNIRIMVYDANNTVISTNDVSDLDWHYIFYVADRSGNLTLYLDGASEGTYDISGIAGEDLNNAEPFAVGISNLPALGMFHGQIALVEQWYLGKDGLPTGSGNTPADYATWRTANPFAPLSQFNNGGWNGYADALRTELYTTVFVNGSGSPYETFTTAGLDITSAINTTGYGGCASGNSISIVNGSLYEVIYTLTLNSGTAPTVVLVSSQSGSSGYQSNSVVCSSGTNSAILKATATGNFYLEFSMPIGGLLTNFSLTDISLKRVGQVLSLPLDGDYEDRDIHHVPGVNGLGLTAGGTGNRFVPALIQ